MQTILNDRERIRFANQHHQGVNIKHDMGKPNPNFRPKPKPHQFEKTSEQLQKPEPMEVDRSSMNVNIGKQKRQASMNTNMNRKMQTSGQYSGKRFQQINKVEETENDDNSVYASEGEMDDSEEETSSVFLE